MASANLCSRAFTPPDGSQRWYIVPDVCDWHSILDWLVQRALPQHVPDALRRSRSPLALDPQLQSPDEIAARRALEELKATFAEQQRDLENQLEQATANAEPIRNGLLYGTGTDLENAIAAVLEAAGLNVVKVDELLGDTTSADLVVTLAGKRRLIEVKSASGSAAETLVRQLETHLQTWPQLRPNDPVDGGLLVVNHQYDCCPTSAAHPCTPVRSSSPRSPRPCSRRENCSTGGVHRTGQQSARPCSVSRPLLNTRASEPTPRLRRPLAQEPRSTMDRAGAADCSVNADGPTPSNEQRTSPETADGRSHEDVNPAQDRRAGGKFISTGSRARSAMAGLGHSISALRRGQN
jgi:hypothetical protein